MTPIVCLVVAVGGAFGSVARFALKEWLSRPGDAFPWPTFLANAVGSFILGIVFIACKERPTLALLLGVGVCGGFTTFSTFSFEALLLLQSNRIGLAMLYVLSSVAVGLLAVWLGMRAAGA